MIYAKRLSEYRKETISLLQSQTAHATITLLSEI